MSERAMQRKMFMDVYHFLKGTKTSQVGKHGLLSGIDIVKQLPHDAILKLQMFMLVKAGSSWPFTHKIMHEILTHR